MSRKSIEELRQVVSMLANYIWTKQLRPGEHLWSIPVDRTRDFDCILNDAITELAALRESIPTVSPGWQPIETAPKDGSTLILRFGDLVETAHWHDNDNTSHPWKGWSWHTLTQKPGMKPTHWMPLPAPPTQEQP